MSTENKKFEFLVDYAIRNKWSKGLPRLSKRTVAHPIRKPVPITEVVVHGTGGGGTYMFVLGGWRKEQYLKNIALFHYLIQLNEKIIEILDPDNFVFHSSSSWHDATTIGIEIENPHKFNDAPYTEWQYEALGYLIFDKLLEKYPTINKIVSHNMNGQIYSRKSKACPGAGFDWTKLEYEMEKRNISYKKLKDEIYIFEKKRNK